MEHTFQVVVEQLVILLQQIPHKVIMVEVDLTKLLSQDFLVVVVAVVLLLLVPTLLQVQQEMVVQEHQIQF